MKGSRNEAKIEGKRRNRRENRGSGGDGSRERFPYTFTHPFSCILRDFKVTFGRPSWTRHALKIRKI